MKTPWLVSKYMPLAPSSYKEFNFNIDGKNFIAIINPDIGSWTAFEENEYIDYKNGVLDLLKMELLYMRGLALDDSGSIVDYDFPDPAEYPNIVIINLTTACNLKCKYCFADCTSDGEYMDTDVMKRIVNEMYLSPYPNIIFELQGGEPLCHLEGMEKFLKIAEELKPADKIVTYRTVTNGTLINKRFIELVQKYHIKICISIDGPKTMTDKYRVFENGDGAFDKIMDGVRLLRENNIKIDGSICTLGKHNIDYPKEIVSFFAENNIKFKPRPANILGREINNNTTTNPGEWLKAYKIMHNESKKTTIDNFSVHIYEENVYTPVRDYICMRYPCGALREVISVNPNGDVFPCDGFKGESEWCVGNLLSESLEDILKKEKSVKLRNRTAQTIKKCSECPFRAMCCSCAYSAFGAYGDVFREDPHCSDKRGIFLFLIENWIRENMQ